MRDAREVYAAGVTAVTERRLPAARRLLERARELADDPDLRARIDASLAFVAVEVGDLDGALEMCDRALDSRGIGPDTVGVLQSQRALILERTGDFAGALAAFGASLDSLDDPVERAKALVNRGLLHVERADHRRAVADLGEAAMLMAEHGKDVEAAVAEHNLGCAHLLGGDLVAALTAMDRARPTLLPLSPVGEAICNQDRAEVLIAAGLVSRGSEDLRVVARVYGARRMHQRRGEAQLSLARTLAPSDFAAALAAARQAALAFSRVGSDGWRVRADAVAFAAEVDLGRTGPRLIDRGAGLVTELEAQGMRWGAASVRLQTTRVMIRRGDLDGARTTLRIAPLTASAPLPVRLLHHGVRAELEDAAGHRADSLAALRKGLVELHGWQSSFGSLDLQTGVAAVGVRLGVGGLALAVESRRPAVLFEWSERARMLASRVQPVRAPDDEQIVADLTDLRRMAAEGERRNPAREAELRQRVRERAWQHRGSGEVADPVTLDEMSAALGDDTALVAYVVTADAVVALVVTSTDTTWIDLGHRAELDALLGGLLPDLDMAATDLSDAMGAFVRAELAQRLGTIAELMVTPVLHAVGDRRVVLTPSGVLSGVPWTLLPGYVGRPVTLAQSATAWLARTTTPLRTATAGFVAGPRVARAEDEVVAAAKEWPTSRTLLGPDATAAAVSALADSVDVLHIAAHGRHSAENAMFAGVQLYDGSWFGYDIDRLQRVPDVVLLSACEVGRSTVRWGEELIGMTTAWLHAGARCVIASPSAISDEAAYSVLVAVHERLAAGLDPAAALAEAVPAVSAESAPVPLVCFG